MSGNDIVNIATSTLNKTVANLAAVDGGGTPYVQLYSYQYVTNGGIPLYLNQYGGNVAIANTSPQHALDVTGTVRATKVAVGTGASPVTWTVSATTPEGAITAPIGSIHSDNVTGAIYRKTSGAGNTGWVTP